MKKILPVELTEWQQVPAKTKTGRISKTRKQWDLVHVADEQECESFEIMYRGKKITVWVPVKHMGDSSHNKSVIYTETGERIMAEWRHGHYGSEIHTEPALFNWEKKVFVERTDYCDGRVKDSYKYLLKVLI